MSNFLDQAGLSYFLCMIKNIIDTDLLGPYNPNSKRIDNHRGLLFNDIFHKYAVQHNFINVVMFHSSSGVI